MTRNLLRQRLTDAYNTTALVGGLAALATLLWFLWMHLALSIWPAPYPLPHDFHADVDSPALALELARNAGDVKAVVHPGAATYALRLYELRNCIYIPFYVAYLALFALAYESHRWLRTIVLGAVAALAVSDALKIVLALRILEGGQVEIYLATLARWLLLALVLGLSAAVLLSKGKGPYSIATRRLLGLVYCAIALLLVLAVCFGQYRWLALGNRLFVLTALFNAIGLAGPAFALHGRQLQSDPDFCRHRKVASRSTREAQLPSPSLQRPK